MDIKGFYKEKTILVTGTTGFIGKVVLEKILRTTPDVRRIYIMVRGKKAIHPLSRLEDIFASEIFTRLW